MAMVASVQHPPSEFAVIEQFLAAMREKGIEVDEPIVADGHLHRYHVAGDRRSSTNAWAKLHIDARPAGMFGCNKRFPGEKFPWKMEGGRDLTAAERREMKAVAKARAAERAAQQAARWQEAADRALDLYNAAQPVESHPYLTLKGVPTSPRLRVGNWYYVNEETGEEILISSSALLVPIEDRERRIHSLQAILPDREDPDAFRKQYLKYGKKDGHFFGIGRPVDNTLLICEGLATGLSLWQCTGHGVIVAFDAGNLLSVAKAIRAAKPDWRILICADNDQWTEKPVKNPGVHYARDAAVATGALVACPEFLSLDTKPTDFNDLHSLEGEEIVRDTITRALAPTPSETEVRTMEPGAADPDLPIAVPPKGDGSGGPSKNPYFQILGYNLDRYYIYQYIKKQVLEYTSGTMNDGGFIQLAPIDWWEANFRGSSGGIDKRRAMEFMMQTADQRGIYDPDKNRGRGAWVDDGRHVFHHGQYLTVDGEKMDCTRIRSRYIYQLRRSLDPPSDTPLSDAEGSDLVGLASKFRWVKPGSGPLLMGWIALAPLCGALKWRPHIWLTGNAGSGKSTILEYFINKLTSRMNIFAEGNSTEAGIRQELTTDAMPVIFDETEQNEDRDSQRIQSVLSLMRQSSSESHARTFKGTTSGTAQHFHIRSMFCLASIQVGVKHRADSERISVLVLKPALKSAEAGENWRALEAEIHAKIGRDDTIHQRLLRRTIDLLPTTLKNIETFKAVAAKHFRSQRSGDQYGTLMAGAYSLMRRTEVSVADAEYFINSFDWSDHIDDNESDEGARALQGLLSAHIRAPRGIDLSVHEIISVAKMIPTPGVDLDPDMAIALLNRYGMRIVDDYLVLSNTSDELRNLMGATQFKVDWRGILLRVPGVDRNENKPIRMNGVLVKVTRIPLSAILEDKGYKPFTAADAAAAEPQIPF